MGVKISIDTNAVRMKLEAANEKALKEIKEQILSDCNKFCPEDQGVLISSSQDHSSVVSISGKPVLQLVWSTPYAKFLYYGLLMVGMTTKRAWAKFGEHKELANPKKELTYHKKHQSSTPRKLWCEKARETKNEEWQECYQNALRGNLK